MALTPVPPANLPPGPQTAPGPGVHLIAITPSDTTIYNPPLIGLWVGAAGNVAVLALGDTTPQTISNISGGTMISWILIAKVMSTNTTSTLMLGVS